MTINYDYYRIFYVVAQCRSFTRAAELLKNNQPNITRCMKNLEQELGCKLFHRSNKGITLTPEGQRFYRRVAAAVEQLQLGEEEIRRDGSLESGSLSISASEAALHMILLDKLSIFRAQYPGVHLRITNETTPQAIERLRDGESDFAVITAPLSTGRTLQQTELLRFTEIPVCGPAYSDMAARRCTMAELANCPLVCLGEDTSTTASPSGWMWRPPPWTRSCPWWSTGWASVFTPASWRLPASPGGSCSASRWTSPSPSGPSPWWRTPPVPVPPP